MSWSKNAKRRFTFIDKARQALGRAFAAFNRSIYTSALEQATELNTDASGRLITDVYNITHANKTGLYISQRIVEENKGIFERLIRSMQRLFGLNTEYFGDMADVSTFEPTARERLFLTYGYDLRTGALIPGGYLANSLFGNPAASQIVKLMQDAINAKMTLAEFRRTFKAFFAPPGSPGAIERHFKRWTFDFYQQFDRLAQLEFKNELGFTHAIYAGTIVDDSRDFCMDRNNLLYTEPEIITWNFDDWQGKIPGQDVRMACGGYNCRHSLNWVSDKVARALIQRGYKLNTYN